MSTDDIAYTLLRKRKRVPWACGHTQKLIFTHVIRGCLEMKTGFLFVESYIHARNRRIGFVQHHTFYPRHLLATGCDKSQKSQKRIKYELTHFLNHAFLQGPFAPTNPAFLPATRSTQPMHRWPPPRNSRTRWPQRL